jgi:hypothetical protein
MDGGGGGGDFDAVAELPLLYVDLRQERATSTQSPESSPL